MSCYFRRLGQVFREAGLEPKTKDERKKIDLAVRETVGKSGVRCPEVWKEIKTWLLEPEKRQQLIRELKNWQAK